MSLPPGFLDELRSRISLAQIVGRRVAWDPRKSNAARGDWWAPCPFHQEKSASFHVDEAKGYYYCFGCHAKGDAVSFLRETENLGFVEAVERLASEAGMAMPERDPAVAARAAANQGLVEAMEAAVQFYRLQLSTTRAAEARAYLDRRGLAPATRDRFELGFAPEGRTALLEHLTAKGFPQDRLAEAGLIGLPRDGGTPYDRFRGRIAFPIRDARGRAIAFGARAIAPGQEPKYLNSPDTPLFDKGRTLYNVGPARAAAGKAGTVIVTEGYMDVIALAQAGLDHVVAPLGTAITEAQLEMLWKLAPEPVVALDGDSAGMGAAQRLIDLALPHLGPGRSLRFALMPPGQDPDDVVRAGGGAALQPLLDASRPIVELLWTRETAGAVLDSPERRAALDARLRAHLARIGDPALRAHWQAEIRARRAALFAPTPRHRPARPSPRRPAAAPMPTAGVQSEGAARPSLLASGRDNTLADARFRESAILSACLSDPLEARRLEANLERISFRCKDLAGIRDVLLSVLAEPLDSPSEVLAAVALRIGRDPMPALRMATPRRSPWAAPDIGATALEEALIRYAALSGRADELRDAALELASGLDETTTARLRAANEADDAANAAGLADDLSAKEAERLEFANLVKVPKPHRPRKR